MNDVSNIVFPNLFFGLCMPGVSIKIICESGLFTIAFIAFLVVCGLFAVAATFSPTNEFIMLDFPTLVFPTIDTKPDFILFTSSCFLFACQVFIYS